MTKTLQHIKNEWAKHHGYIDYKEFYELTRVVDTDQVFIMDGAVNQIAIRYAQEQNKELVEMLRECASVLRWTLDNAKPDSDWTTFTNSITNAMVASEELIKSATEG